MMGFRSSNVVSFTFSWRHVRHQCVVLRDTPEEIRSTKEKTVSRRLKDTEM